MPHKPVDDPREPNYRPGSSREVFLPPQSHEEDLPATPPDERPLLALPKKRPLIMWIGIALLFGGVLALILVVLIGD
ncbi:MAG TPA: hypothetical protein VNV84_06070 [Candidatus Acidoferrales bacterium]|nr:hypothetical protein [Candidatus Acidoferrales bacterium]